MNKKDESINFRTKAGEKALFQERAQRAGASMSAFIRCTCLSDEKVIFLEEGQEINQMLAQIWNYLDDCRKHQRYDATLTDKWMQQITKTWELFYRLEELITTIRSDEEEEASSCQSPRS